MDVDARELLRAFLGFLRGRSTRDLAGGGKSHEYILHLAQGTQMHPQSLEADGRVGAFLGRRSRGAWRHLTRQEIGLGIMANLRFPSLIKQGPSSLCGPSSLLFGLIKDRPVAYAQFAINLYERGWWGFTNGGGPGTFIKKGRIQTSPRRKDVNDYVRFKTGTATRWKKMRTFIRA